MADFYPSQDQIYFPFTINAANKVVEVIEDPNGTPAGNTVNLEESSTFTGRYYATASADPIDGQSQNAGSPPTLSVLNAANDSLTLAHLYEHIADKLTANSPKGLTYRFESATPSGSDQTNSGLTLTTSGGSNEELQYNFKVSNTLDPSFFGFGSDKKNSSVGTAITGPKSRAKFGIWYSQVEGHDKRHRDEYETFSSSSHPRFARTHRVTEREITRQLQYVGVAGVHIWPNDRAGRSAEADRGGVPTDDNNNVLFHLWDRANFDDRDIIIAHHEGPGSGSGRLDAGFASGEEITVGRLTSEFGQMYAPQEDTDREHRGEKYDVSIRFGEPLPSSYASGVTRYGH